MITPVARLEVHISNPQALADLKKARPRLGTDLTIEHQAVILNMKRALPADGWPLS